MTKQPEALRLAEHLENFRRFPDDLAAAAELRRLHERDVQADAQIKELLQTIEDLEHHSGLLSQRVQGLGEIVRIRSKRVIELEKRVNELEAEARASYNTVEKLPRYTYGYKSDEWGMGRALTTYASKDGKFLLRDEVLAAIGAGGRGAAAQA